MANDNTFSFSNLVLLFGITSAFIILIYHFIQRSNNRRKLIEKHGCQLASKYPQKSFYFGLDLLQDVIRAVKSHRFVERGRRVHKDLGKTYTSYLLDSKTLHTIEPENLKAVLSTSFKDYGISQLRKITLGPLLGHSILLLDGTQWEHSRALLRPSFARSQISNLAMFETHIQNLLKAIPSDRSTVDLAVLFSLLTADVTTDLMFGESLNSLSNIHSLPKQFLENTREIEDGFSMRNRRGRLANLFPQREFYRKIKEVHAFIDQYVESVLAYRRSLQENSATEDDAENKGQERYILLHELGKVTDDRYILRGELLTIFSAGRDTTAVLLSNIFYMLARRTDIWQKLRTEIRDLKGEKPSFEQLNRMEYLKWSVNESLRLDPPLPYNARVALKDTVLPRGGGTDGQSPVLVVAGTTVLIDMSALHRDEDLWGKDAGGFRPERWREDKRSWVRLRLLCDYITPIHND